MWHTLYVTQNVPLTKQLIFIHLFNKGAQDHLSNTRLNTAVVCLYGTFSLTGEKGVSNQPWRCHQTGAECNEGVEGCEQGQWGLQTLPEGGGQGVFPGEVPGQVNGD